MSPECNRGEMRWRVRKGGECLSSHKSTALLFTSYLFYLYFLLYIKYKIYTEQTKNDKI